MDGEEDGAEVRVPLLSAADSGAFATAPPDNDPPINGDPQQQQLPLYPPDLSEFPFFDETLLEELRSIHEHDIEAGAAAGAGEELPHADDDVFKMRELIDEKPEDVLHYIEEQGVLKVCEFEVQDSLAFRAFQSEGILTMGADHFEVDWETMWRERLAEGGKATGAGWTTTVLLEAHVVNLRDAAASGSKGLLQPLLKRYQAGGCSMAVFALPAVQAVIHFKWTNWARRFLLYELAAYCTWLLAFTAFTLLFQHEDWSVGMWTMLRNPWGLAATACSFLSVTAMLPFMYMDVCTLAAYSAGWAASPWNILDMASYVLQFAITTLHLQRDYVDEGWFSVMIATQHVLMWTKLQYFARVFNPTKTTFIDTIRLVMEDMKWFLLFLLMTMVGFGMAFYALYRQDREQFMDFANLWHSFASMFSYLLAMFDYNVFYNSTNPTAAMVLFIIFEFVMNVMMLNIMIASMTNSFSKVTQDEGLRFLASKAEIIDELEATLPGWLKARAWFPPFIHILKFHPDSTYEVNLNSLWSGIGLMETNLLNAQEETRRRVEDMEERTLRVHRKLDVLIKMVLGLHPPPHLAALARQASRAAAAPSGARLRGSAAAVAAAAQRAAAAGAAARDQAGSGGAPVGGERGGSGVGDGLARASSGMAGLADQLERISGPLQHGPALHHWATLGHLPSAAAHGGYHYGHVPYPFAFPAPPPIGAGISGVYGPLGAAAGGAGGLGGAGASASQLQHSPPSPYAGPYWGSSAGPFWAGSGWGTGGGGGGGGRVSIAGGGGLGLSPTASVSERSSSQQLAAAAAAGAAAGTERGERAEGVGSRSGTPHAGAGAPQSPFAAANASRAAAGAAARRLAAAAGPQLRRPAGPPGAMAAPPQYWAPHPYAAIPIPIPMPGVRGAPAGAGHWPHGPAGPGQLHPRDVLPHSV